MGKADSQRLNVLFDGAAKTTYDSNPKLWHEVLEALNLELCYQPAVAEVLRQVRWRTAANPRAYVATAAVRWGRRKNLPDYSDKEFRRVASGELNGDVGTRIYSGAGFDLENWGGGDDYDYGREIPQWLQRGAEYDAVDWETVAAYAVLKPQMACRLARVLIMRLELRLGRPEAMAGAANDDEAAAIEATWKWIDRNTQDRIAPLFKMAVPPRTLTPAGIASFPLIAPEVSVRVDFQLQWNGKQLLLARSGLLPDGDGLTPVFCMEAESEAAAMDQLRLTASQGEEGEESEIFHFWVTEPASDTLEKSFVKPWEVLSRLSNKASCLS